MLEENELYYKKVMSAIGITMLVFLALMTIFGISVAILQFILGILPISALAYDLVYYLFYMVGYLAVFMLPVFVLKRKMEKIGYPYFPMKSTLHFSPLMIPVLIGGVTLIWAQANINASLVSIFDYAAFTSKITGEDPTVAVLGYQIVLLFIVDCMVPAFCEEFLFRGAILTNCLPFGRSTAILISSLLFSLMHQNAAQILYAFAAGILLGILYERTGSIWCCTFLHLVNNFLSTVLPILANSFGFELSGITYLALESVLYLIGLICIVILVIYESKPKNLAKDGIFGVSLPAADSHAAVPVMPNRAVRLFLNAPMIIFLALCVAEILTLLGASLLYEPIFF